MKPRAIRRVEKPTADQKFVVRISSNSLTMTVTGEANNTFDGIRTASTSQAISQNSMAAALISRFFVFSGIEELFNEILLRNRLGVQITLSVLAADVFQEHFLLFGFNTFTDNVHIKFHCHADNVTDNNAFTG